MAGGGNLTLNNVTVSGGNESNSGGIYNNGTVTLTNSTISGNSAFIGGGIYNNGTVTLTNSTISGNSASYRGPFGGGGIFNVGGIVNITNSTISGNSADNGQGGGIWSATGSTMTITNSTISGNSADERGGGIYNGSELIITNSTFSDNSATWGGGIFSNAGTTTLTNSTLSGNSASSRGAGIDFGDGGTLTITNSLIANSLGSGNCRSANLSGGNNLSDDTSCVIAQNDFIYLDVLNNYGGPTETHALLTGISANSAIDTANPANCPTDDQRGVARPINGGVSLTCDIGAYEYLGVVPTVAFTVDVTTVTEGGTATVTVTPSNYTTGDITVQFAISGTATPVTDYTLTGLGANNRLTFSSGAAQNFTISSLTDALIEGSETVTLDMFLFSGAADIVGTTPQTVTIVDPQEIEVEDSATNMIADSGSFTFATTTLGTSITETMTVTNIGGVDLTLTNPPTITGDFTIGNFGATTLVANASTTFDITCNATTLGAPNTGTVSFTNDDADENPFDFTVNCTVIDEQEIEVEDSTTTLVLDSGSFTFPSTTPGTSVTETMTVTNIGGVDLTLTNPPTITGDFSIGNFGATTLVANASTTFDITCDATTLGAPNTGTVSFVNDDADENPFDFTVNCTVDAVASGSGSSGSDSDGDESVAPQIDVFDPAISKIGVLHPGQIGLVGEELEWIITVTNNGNVVGNNIVLVDNIIPALQIDGVSSNVNSTINGQTVIVTIPTLDPGQSVTYSIFTTVLESSITVDNTVCLSSDSGGEVCTGTTVDTGLAVVSQLPLTGETPNWRNPLMFVLASGGLLLLTGLGIIIRRRVR